MEQGGSIHANDQKQAKVDPGITYVKFKNKKLAAKGNVHEK